jgi:hypothetical protein
MCAIPGRRLNSSFYLASFAYCATSSASKCCYVSFHSALSFVLVLLDNGVAGINQSPDWILARLPLRVVTLNHPITLSHIIGYSL